VNPDVVHLHSFVAGFVGRLPHVSGAVPLIYQPHAWSFELYGNERFRRATEAWERFADRRTDMLVTNCADEVAEGRAVGVTSEAVPIGVALDTAHFSPVSEQERERHRHELGLSGSRMILCLGRLARQKGQDQLVEAWERTPVADTTLVLAGPGDWESLRGLAPTQWTRSIRCIPERSDVRPLLWACDVLVLPSRYETVSLVAAEAMACGRPVVAARVNGVAEAVLDPPLPPAGTVVPLSDMHALLAEAGHRLRDPAQWDRESAAARERALRLFSTTVVVDRLESAYARARAEARARQ
jgi:glycosyltransferase involved in cell wall biosynthesis